MQAHTDMRILIADDHRLMIEAVKTKLSEIAPDVEFLLATNVEELLSRADDALDLAVVDLVMPGAEGYEHVAEFHRRHPAVPVIVLSGCEEPALMRAVLSHGVLGFIPKMYSSDVMLSAVRLVLAGGVYVPPIMLWPVPTGHAVDVSKPATPTVESLCGVLTERQMEVLHLLSQGKPNKLIGRSLGISEGTVKIHVAAVFRALNARNRTEAVIAARSLTEASLH